MATRNAQNLTPQTLAIIRVALLSGVLIFGAVAFFLSSGGGVGEEMDRETLSTLQLVFFGLMAMEGAVMFFFQQRWKQATTFEEQARWSIAGWALGEGLALFGAVILLLGGSILPFLGGLIFFALAWLLFPIRADA